MIETPDGPTVTWPASFSGWDLVAALELGEMPDWQTVPPQEFISVRDQLQYRPAENLPPRFFRLRAPLQGNSSLPTAK